MTDDLEKLAALLRDDIPAPSSDAKKAAIMAGMQAFAGNSENFQGSPDAARPIHNRSKTGRGLLEGLKDMFKNLSGRQVLLGTASFATIALAVVITQDIKFDTGSAPDVGFLGIDVIDGTLATQEITKTNLGITDDLFPTATITDQPALSAPILSENEMQDLFTRTDTPDESRGTYGANLAYDADSASNGMLPFDGNNMAGYSDVPVGDQFSQALADQNVTIMSEEMAAPRERTEGEADLRRQNLTDSMAPAGAVMSLAAPSPEAVIGGLIGVADMDTQYYEPEANRDQFAGEAINPLKITVDEPVSTFSIDVDTASYAFARNAILGGYLPNPDAVRTEEMINYFTYDYPVPQPNEAPFTTSVTVTDTPWNPDTQLLHIGIQGYELAANERPPVNLVFLIDTSGSMSDHNKLPLLIQSFRLLLSELNDHDSVAIVTYAGRAGMVLEPTPATERTKILNSLTRLSAGGSTAGQAGLQQAYALAAEMADDGDTSRVILATDGDFNVGISNTEELKAFIEEKRDTGIYLSILGFGQGNYNDALMQTLAQNGNGTAAYIDTLAEAQKVLVDQIGGALFTIAQDVKIQVEFNPAEVAEYRLIGYETRALAREDFNNDAVDAGDIGAGHSVTALYEITPVGSAALSNDPLRYGEAEPLPQSNGELAFLKLRYKNPGESTSILITTPVFSDADAGLGAEVDFAAAVAGFGQLLRGDTRLGDWSFDEVVALANASKGADNFGYRAEFIRLVRLAETAQ